MLRRKNIAFVTFLVLVLELQTCLSEINRSSFPKGFVFGTASSAFQYEGAVKEDGRGPSIWDTFSHTKGKINDSSNADVAVDHYHRFAEDIRLMKGMGMDAFRLSISWSRIYPNGAGEINQAGVDHYNKVIDALLAQGIEPYVTIFHWDLPQALQDKYAGWLSRKIIKDYATFAETCFQKFGDRVKHWITFNEPHIFVTRVYDEGFLGPLRCPMALQPCKAGDSGTVPYIVGHHVLLSQATLADIYRKKYKAKQGGSLGVSFDVMWFEPSTNTTKDKEAAQRALDFQLGWFLDPLMVGDYPSSMRSRLGSRLPRFSAAEAALLKGSLDFVGINHYTTFYAKDNSTSVIGKTNDPASDSGTITFPFPGESAHSAWLHIVPEGMRKLMNYIKQKYGNPLVIITENGLDDANDIRIPLKKALQDQKRIRYHNSYLTALLASIKEDGCKVKGYFVWSLLDNWEWGNGYTSRYGLYFVDYNDNVKRYAKDSVQWFKKFLSS